MLFGLAAFILTLCIAFFITRSSKDTTYTDGIDISDISTINDKNRIINEHISKHRSEAIETMFNGISVTSLEIESEDTEEDIRSAILSIQADDISDDEINKMVIYLRKSVQNLSEDNITILDDNQNQLFPLK